MEERMIDEEYGRGIRLKKTKDGYVDVTDELAEETEENAVEETEGNEGEIAFEFPMLDTDEDDEDLVGLSPEEALRLRQQKAEAARIRREEYDKECLLGQTLLDEGKFEEAEKQFEKALLLDVVAIEASVGYWRAKTENFENPDALVGEYADASIESLEYDLGIEAVEIIKREHKASLQKRYDELKEEEKPLAERVEGATARRREIINGRLKKAWIFFGGVAVPLAAAVALTIAFALQIFTPKGDAFITWTIVAGSCAFVCFLAFIVATNKLINTLRIRRANERLGGTEEGDRLVEVRDYMTIYENLLDIAQN